MTIVKRLVIILGAFIAILAIGLAVRWIGTAPEPFPPESESTSRLAAGPHAIGRLELRWVDRTRPTSANGDYPGADERVFPVTMWFPEDGGGKHPLVVFVHGLLSSREGCTPMAENLASYGYVVVAADHPLTHARAPGGANYLDVVHQPADVSFLIDRTLGLEERERPFEGELDPDRIGLFGISLGGATATLTAFHPEWRDPRVAAAISISGPGDVFGPAFFDHASVPFLMIAGTKDAIVDYAINAAPIPDRVRRGGLLTIEGGTHAGSTYLTAGVLRLLGNPDAIGCGAAEPGEIPQERSVFVGLFGSEEQGLIVPAKHRPPCGTTYEGAMRAGRQQMILTVAVRAFFSSTFADTAEERKAHQDFLERTLPAELPEVTWTPSRRSPVE